MVALEQRRDVHAHAELALEGLAQAVLVPLFLDALGRDVLADRGVDDLGANRADRVGDVARLHELRALLIDDAALVVRDVVVFEQLLADVEVVRLDLALRALDLPRQELALDRLAGLHAGARQHALDALGIAEDAHEVVFERQIEPARARIALAARTAAQLIVDAPRLVPLGADDVQAAHLETFAWRCFQSASSARERRASLGRRRAWRARPRDCRRA